MDSEDEVFPSKAMMSKKKMRPAIHDDSDDLFNSENSSVSSEDENTDITEKHHRPCVRAGRKITKQSDVVSSEDELSDVSVSEEEYIPDTSGETSDSISSISLSGSPKHKRKFQTVIQCSSFDKKGKHCDPQSSGDLGSLQNKDASSPPDRKRSVLIPAIIKKRDGARMYNKKQHCLFCGSDFTKISRHLERKHSNELEVARALSHQKGSRERRMQLEFLRNKGNFAHNATVINAGEGEMIPRKLPKKNLDGERFMHCIYCQGLFLKKTLWRHLKICKFKRSDVKPKPGRTRVQALCGFAQPPPPGVTHGVWKLLNAMNQDEVALAARNDWSILELGKHLYNKCGSRIKMHEYIRQKMRELGRLLICARKVSPLTSIKELTNPENFLHTVDAVKETAGYNEETGLYENPSIAVKLGQSLNKIAMLIESQSIISGDKATAKAANSFQQLYQSRWSEYISASARRTLEEAKWNKPTLLPFTEDVKLLHLYLDEQEKIYYKLLSAQPLSHHWSKLAKVTLTQVMLFNRRREGEVSQMPLSAYTSSIQSDAHPDISMALSELENKLCQYFKRIEIRGKRGRKVPVLVTPSMQESINLLIKYRDRCGVPNENSFLFARPFAMTYYRGSDCIREFARACNIENPETLTTTKLRKQIGTLSEVLNLSNTELDLLADFLGHDIRVHRQFYRLPEGTLQLAKMSKIFLALEKGRLADFKGKSLDEIDIDPEEKVTVDSDLEDTQLKECTQVSAPHTAIEDCNDSLLQADRGLKKKASAPQTAIEHCDDSLVPADKGLKKKGEVKRTPWNQQEVHAVEKHLMKFIKNRNVPRKTDCVRCIEAEPQALKNREWSALKIYIKNRISALQRKDLAHKLG
nr:uncharacterized protein LOC129434425 [Misgurnus anguillicaudatus]